MVAVGVPENHGRHGYFGSGGIRGDPRPEFQKPVCASRGGNDSVTPKFIAPGILELVARRIGWVGRELCGWVITLPLKPRRE